MTGEGHARVAACVFDAYGTLIDFGAAVEGRRDRIGEAAGQVNALWRQKQLEYTWLRSLMGRHADFWQVTGDALDFALAATGFDDPALRDRLMDLYRKLEPFPEVPDTLDRLKTGGMRCAILSNGAPDMLNAAVTHAGLDRRLDACLSVEEVGVFKPDPRVYQLAVDRLGVARKSVCFLSSNTWDAAGAASFGFRVVWINRYGQPPERLPDGPEVELDSLATLPDLLGLA